MARVYRNINSPVRVFGLELIDVVLIIGFFLLVFNVSDHLVWNTALLILFYGAVRFFKVGKPEGYALHLVRFLLSPTEYRVILDDSLSPYLDENKRSRL